MSNTVRVNAAPGSRVPRESHPRSYYPAAGDEPEAVERTPHIERLLLTGDLIDADAPPAAGAEG